MTLENLREKIDQTDRQISQLLETRLGLVSEIALYKKEHMISVLDSKREEQLLTNIQENIQKDDFKTIIQEIFIDIIRHSRDYQEKKIGKN